jgi:plastocyanin
MKQFQTFARYMAPFALTGLLAFAACSSNSTTPSTSKDTTSAGDACSDGGCGTTDGGDVAGTDAGASDTLADSTGTDAGASDTLADVADVENKDTVDAGATDAGAIDVADTADTAPTCEQYCAAVTTACTGDLAQYVSQDECLTYCKQKGKLQAGKQGETSGNTIGCRLYHATVAGQSAENAKTHCVHTGPSGGNVCGTWCDNYCDLALKNCTAENKLYSLPDDCPAACAKATATGKAGATSGDTVQCRIYHLGVAGTDQTSAKMHCPHGKVPSDAGSPCSDVAAAVDPTCEEYCSTVTKNCTGDLAQYASKDACLTYCKTQGKLPAGKAGDTSGNTIGCRTYHATVAGKDAASALTHCVHTGPSGGDVCGSWCDNYCWLAKSNCTAEKALYSTDADCASKCNAIKNNGNAGATSGDTVQCRIYHLGVAGTDATQATTHCPHGKSPADPGTPCTDAKVNKLWEVKTVGFAFDPPELTIAVGDSVSFMPGAIHTATQVEKSTWDATPTGNTPMIGGFNVPGGTMQTVKFDKAGDVYYVCIPHASGGMKGHILVK